MIKKENHYLFYIFALVFLFATYIGRDILSPAEHYFVLLYQIPSMIVLPFLYRQLLPISRFISGVLFFLFFVLMWDTFNHLPIVGFFITAVLYDSYHINLGLEWTSYVLKPLGIFCFLYFNRHTFLTFFNALISTKEYQIDPKFVKKVDNIDDLNPTYLSKPYTIYFNEWTQNLTLSYKKNGSGWGGFFFYYLTLSHDDNRYFFFNYKKHTVSNKMVKIVDDILFIKTKRNFFAFDWLAFPPSLKDLTLNIIAHRDVYGDVNDDKEEKISTVEYHEEILPENMKQTKPPLIIDNH